MFRFEVNGLDEIARKLRALEDVARREVLTRALLKGAEPIRAAAAARATRGEGPGPNLADNIVIAEVPDPEYIGADAAVAIGPSGGKGGDDFFYGYFLEWGTVKQRARPFMRPAYDGNVARAFEIIRDDLAQELLRR